ncbi:hypothetical protein GP486_006449 [Trichoglossum hirsutum]|uniref:Ankyrin repeat protein n=1 Tax=Trichoglossum hirsutum TaxID=265104 RepID=A0A9P8I829_9PEZI|nr:hypothetical protein GP486_006449 [Trichoglossum hirsutum]
MLPPPVTSTARPAVVRRVSKPTAEKRGGRTKLHRAAMANDHHQLAHLLQQDTYLVRRSSKLTIPGKDLSLDINAKDEIGRTALHWAVTLNHVESINVLLQDGRTDRNCQDEDGRTLLHEAAINGFDNLIEVLLPSRDSQGNSVGKQSLEGNKGNTAWLDKSDRRGRTALHWAAEYGHLPVVKCLIDSGASASSTNHDQKDTALHRAALRNNATVVDYLIDKKPELAYAKNNAGDTPLDIVKRTTKDWKYMVGVLRKSVQHVDAQNEKYAYPLLAQSCIQVMSTVLTQGVCGQVAPGAHVTEVEERMVKNYLPEVVQHACLNWVPHLEKSGITLNDDDQFHKFLQEHFLHWLEALSWMRKLSEAIRSINSLESIALVSQQSTFHEMSANPSLRLAGVLICLHLSMI